MRLDWGICENCSKKNMLLNAVIHQPTGVEMWVCNDCIKTFEASLASNQVPGKLGDKIQAHLLSLIPK